jgi:hypothetical protein
VNSLASIPNSLFLVWAHSVFMKLFSLFFEALNVGFGLFIQKNRPVLFLLTGLLCLVSHLNYIMGNK